MISPLLTELLLIMDNIQNVNPVIEDADVWCREHVPPFKYWAVQIEFGQFEAKSDIQAKLNTMFGRLRAARETGLDGAAVGSATYRTAPYEDADGRVHVVFYANLLGGAQALRMQ